MRRASGMHAHRAGEVCVHRARRWSPSPPLDVPPPRATNDTLPWPRHSSHQLVHACTPMRIPAAPRSARGQQESSAHHPSLHAKHTPTYPPLCLVAACDCRRRALPLAQLGHAKLWATSHWRRHGNGFPPPAPALRGAPISATRDATLSFPCCATCP